MIKKLINGDPRVVEIFVRENTPWMLRVARQILSDHSLTEDAVQNAFTNIFSKLTNFEQRSKLTTWMHRIVINEALALLRKRKQNKEEFAEELLPEFYKNGCRIEPTWQKTKTPEEIIQQASANKKILELINNLPSQYRLIIILRDIQELGTSEVADILGISEGNVKIRLHRARAALKKLLEPFLTGGNL